MCVKFSAEGIFIQRAVHEERWKEIWGTTGLCIQESELIHMKQLEDN